MLKCFKNPNIIHEKIFTGKSVRTEGWLSLKNKKEQTHKPIVPKGIDSVKTFNIV